MRVHALVLLLVFGGCTAKVAGLPVPDAGAPDSGVQLADGGPLDAGVRDAGATDAGSPDAGAFDGGEPDAGDCMPTAQMTFPPFPANPPVPDAGVPYVCGPDAGAITDVDAAIAAMPPGSWLELPCTQMANVCPLPYEHYLCEATMTAWSGAALDTTRDRLLVYGGGHADGFYNSIFAFELGTARWARLTDLPNGLTGDACAPAYTDKRLESCGLYPRTPNLCIPNAWLTATGYVAPSHCDDPAFTPQVDPQQPRSMHSYGNIAYSAGTDAFYLLGEVGSWQSGQSGTGRVSGFHFARGSWSRGADNPGIGYGVSATDAAGKIWYASSNAPNLLSYDPVGDVWTATSPDVVNGYLSSAAVDTQRNHLVFVEDGSKAFAYDLGAPGVPQTTAAATGLGAPLPHSPGFDYDPDLDRFIAWGGHQRLAFLNPQTWTWTELTASGADPGAPTPNGTFGRFRYSKTRHVFVSVSGVKDNVFLYKPPLTAP